MTPIPLIKPGFSTQVPNLPPFGGPVRVTTYEIGDAEFTGTTYELTLEQPLSPDYFVVIVGSTGQDGQQPHQGGMRLATDPFGTGELGTSSGATKLGFAVATATPTEGWVGAVTVVECTADQDTRGFRLRDVIVTSVPAATSSPEAVNDTVDNPWTTLGQVVPFGGLRGAGCTTTSTSADDWLSLAATTEVSGTDTLTITRSGPLVPLNLEAATFVTAIVEWGSDWDVQSVTVSGTAGGDGADATGEYNTGSISSVARDNTWVWPTVRTVGCVGIGCAAADLVQAFPSVLVTLGDGVNQNASESSVAVGKEITTSRTVVAYVMENPGLAVDYKFKTDGDSGVQDLDITVDGAGGTEAYDEVSEPRVTAGARLGLVTNGAQGTTGTDRFHWGRALWWARHEADTTLAIRRAPLNADTVTFPAWIQSVDFSGV